MTAAVRPQAVSDPRADDAKLQRRILRTLVTSQVLGGLGVGSGIAVGSLLAKHVSGSDSLAGLAQTASALGAALAAVPIAALMVARGRRPGLVAGYAAGTAGAVLAVVAGWASSYALLLVALLLFGSSTAANLQARYAATDRATPARRAQALAVVVWATTVGVVAGPNLTGPTGDVADAVGLPTLTGPFLLSVLSFATAGAVVLVRLRPDPLARRDADDVARAARQRLPMRQLWPVLRASRGAALGLATMVVSSAVMVAVMVMTPVHMHHGGAELEIIGVVISGHVAGMYALSPAVGWLADRAGRPITILIGQVVLLASMVVAGTAPGDSSWQLGVGLFLLGLGWSFGLVAGSTLLSESVPADVRPGVQGAADLVMGLAGAGGGALSGVIVGAASFGVLTVVGAALVVPLLFVLLPVVAARR